MDESTVIRLENTHMKTIVDIYRSKKKEGAYVYIEQGKALDELPEALLKQCGVLELSLTMVLTPDKKLANANARNVLAALKENGFYLQMPPQPEAYMQKVPNDKLPNQPI